MYYLGILGIITYVGLTVIEKVYKKGEEKRTEKERYEFMAECE